MENTQDSWIDVEGTLKNLNNYSSELSEIKNDEYYYVIPKHYLEHLNGIKYKKLPPESDRPEFEL